MSLETTLCKVGSSNRKPSRKNSIAYPRTVLPNSWKPISTANFTLPAHLLGTLPYKAPPKELLLQLKGYKQQSFGAYHRTPLQSSLSLPSSYYTSNELVTLTSISFLLQLVTNARLLSDVNSEVTFFSLFLFTELKRSCKFKAWFCSNFAKYMLKWCIPEERSQSLLHFPPFDHAPQDPHHTQSPTSLLHRGLPT